MLQQNSKYLWIVDKKLRSKKSYNHLTLNAKTDFTLKSRWIMHGDMNSSPKGFAYSQLVFTESEIIFLTCTVLNYEIVQVVEI